MVGKGCENRRCYGREQNILVLDCARLHGSSRKATMETVKSVGEMRGMSTENWNLTLLMVLPCYGFHSKSTVFRVTQYNGTTTCVLQKKILNYYSS